MRFSLAVFTLAVGLTLLVTPASAQSPEDTSQEKHKITITDENIPLRDGTHLHARIWRPVDTDPVPVLFSLTPYTTDDAHDRGRFFAEHGYVYVNVDTRGRGGSEGTFWPLEGDGVDGHDVIEWLAEQPWSDGRVGMRGGSYRGMVQWQTLAEGPSALETIVPTASVHPGWDYPNPGGIFMSYAARWLGFVGGNASQGSLFGDSDYWNEKYLAYYRNHRPFAALDSLTGISPRVFERWIQHPYYDDFWKQKTPRPDEYAELNELPILTITGHFDGDQPGALKYYENHMQYGPEPGTDRHYLLMGPWSHGGTRDPSQELNDLTFGENSVLDMEELHLDWFDWVFYDEEKPEALENRVTYYVMEANEWKSAPALDAVSNDTLRWHLSSPENDARDVFQSGQLQSASPSSPDVDQMTYDPRTTPVDSAALADSDGYLGPGLAFDEKWTGGPRLIYHSPPLEENVEVSGTMRLDAFIELDVPDTDLLAAVYEIRADGTTIYLGESALRARHRNGVDQVSFATPGEVHRYTFDRFYWFSRLLQKGSRLRVVITPLNSPQVDKNYNSGGNTILETDADARPATIKLHMGPEHPTSLSLPVVRE